MYHHSKAFLIKEFSLLYSVERLWNLVDYFMWGQMHGTLIMSSCVPIVICQRGLFVDKPNQILVGKHNYRSLVINFICIIKRTSASSASWAATGKFMETTCCIRTQSRNHVQIQTENKLDLSKKLEQPHSYSGNGRARPHLR